MSRKKITQCYVKFRGKYARINKRETSPEGDVYDFPLPTINDQGIHQSQHASGVIQWRLPKINPRAKITTESILQSAVLITRECGVGEIPLDSIGFLTNMKKISDATKECEQMVGPHLVVDLDKLWEVASERTVNRSQAVQHRGVYGEVSIFLTDSGWYGIAYAQHRRIAFHVPFEKLSFLNSLDENTLDALP